MENQSSTRLTIQGVWTMRNETLDDAVNHVNSTFQSLASLSYTWVRWYASHAKAENLPQAELALDEINVIRQELLSSQISTNDEPVDYEVGYSMLAQSEPKGAIENERSGFYVRCCSMTQYSRNTLSVRLPISHLTPELYEIDLLCRVINILVDIWDPDWLSIWDLRTAINSGSSSPRVTFGWINYLAKRTGLVPNNLPPGWQWFSGRNLRQIFIHEAGPPNNGNSAHVTAFKRIFEHIDWERLAY